MQEIVPEPARCEQCDSVIPAGSTVCVMCGAPVGKAEAESDAPVEPSPVPPEDEIETDGAGEQMVSDGEVEPSASQEPVAPIPATYRPLQSVDAPAVEAAMEEEDERLYIESRLVERQSHIVLWMTGAVFVITTMLGSLILRYGGPVQVALIPSLTPLPATATLTPSATLPGTPTSGPTETPTITPEPSPTATEQPPRLHQVGEGETLFGLAYIYNVTMDVIAELNGFSVETPIQQGQTLQVPWPTATPPLQPVVVEINGEQVIADPTDCERYVIQAGDALSVIAARNNINFELLLQVNRLTDQSVMQPGDTVCIPEVIHGELLPPTPGPSPTPSPTSFPAGPALLYPTNGIVVEMGDEPIVLQWLAVKDLAPEEWYMVELTDLSVESQHPQRAFTRDNAFRVPGSWRPPVEAYHDFRWRISIVTVTGQREDGGFIYTFGGRFSEDGNFSWRGAIPTATPTATATATPEP